MPYSCKFLGVCDFSESQANHLSFCPKIFLKAAYSKGFDAFMKNQTKPQKFKATKIFGRIYLYVYTTIKINYATTIFTIYMCVYACMHTYAYIRTYTHTCMRTYCTCMHIRSYVHKFAYAYTCTPTHTCYICTKIQTCIYTCTYTYVIYVCTCMHVCLHV